MKAFTWLDGKWYSGIPLNLIGNLRKVSKTKSFRKNHHIHRIATDIIATYDMPHFVGDDPRECIMVCFATMSGPTLHVDHIERMIYVDKSHENYTITQISRGNNYANLHLSTIGNPFQRIVFPHWEWCHPDEETKFPPIVDSIKGWIL